jgi:hypothetical protein
MVHSFELFADYFQFYLQDETASGDLSEAWTSDAVDRLLALAPGVIGVGTARNMNVPVEVEILERSPDDDDFSSWDCVNECSIAVQSGRLVVAGCTDYFADAARIVVPGGHYRARVYYGELGSVTPDGLEGHDHYRIALWLAAEEQAPVVRKPRSVPK